MRKLLPCLIFISLVCLPICLRADEVIEEIIARVNNQIITRSEFLHSKDELRKEAQQQDPVNADKLVAERDKDVKRTSDWIRVAAGEGQRSWYYGRHRSHKKARRNAQGHEARQHGSTGKSRANPGHLVRGFQTEPAHNQIITQQVIGKEVGSRLVINKDDEKKFYDEHKAELEQPESVRLSEILVSTESQAE